MVSRGIYMMLGGVATAIGSRAIENPKVRLVVGGAGALLAVWGMIESIDTVMAWLGIEPKKAEGITSSVTTPIENINRGSEGATGIIAGFIKIPAPGAALDKDAGTYAIKLQLQSSLKAAKTVHIELQSKEFYSFGSESEGTMKDFGMVTVPPGTTKVLSGSVRFEAVGPTNPFYPPEVSLTMFMDGAPVSNVRFTYE